jgi:hypothetical protein
LLKQSNTDIQQGALASNFSWVSISILGNTTPVLTLMDNKNLKKSFF